MRNRHAIVLSLTSDICKSRQTDRQTGKEEATRGCWISQYRHVSVACHYPASAAADCYRTKVSASSYFSHVKYIYVKQHELIIIRLKCIKLSVYIKRSINPFLVHWYLVMTPPTWFVRWSSHFRAHGEIFPYISGISQPIATKFDWKMLRFRRTNATNTTGHCSLQRRHHARRTCIATI